VNEAAALMLRFDARGLLLEAADGHAHARDPVLRLLERLGT
jgi:hypothetical protein